MTTHHRDEAGQASSGELVQLRWRTESRRLTYNIDSYILDPGFRTEAGFVRRTDEWRTRANVNYRWWPENWVLNWGPDATYERNLDRDGELQDEVMGAGINVQFARSINANAGYSRGMERFRGIDFWKDARVHRRHSQREPASRGKRTVQHGRPDPVRRQSVSRVEPRPEPRLDPAAARAAAVGVPGEYEPVRRPADPGRPRTVQREDLPRVDHVSVQRPLLGSEHQRVPHVRQDGRHERSLHVPGERRDGVFRRLRRPLPAGNQINAAVFPTAAWRRTNRAIFTKLQYLFRY